MPGGLRPPIDVIASWTFNYDNPERSGNYVVIVTAVMLALTFVVVGLRLWARLRLAKSAGVDDALILFGMIPLTGMAISVCLSITTYGMDKHVWDSKAFELVNARKITMAIELLFMVTTSITKISILLFYRRLAVGTITPLFQYTIYFCIAFVAVYFFVFFTEIFFICKPLDSYWLQADYVWLNIHRDDFHCQNEAVVLVISAVISAVQDILACVLPMILLWKLQIPMRQKYALGAIFSVGIFLCICAILRCIAIFKTYYTTYDMTWESQPAWLWLSIEAHLAVVCASAPALKTFFKHTLKDYTYGFRRSGKSSNPSSLENGGTAIFRGPSESRGTLSADDGVLGVDSSASGGAVTALPLFGYRGAGKSSVPWEIRVDSEHELVYTKKGKGQDGRKAEFQFGQRFRGDF